MRDRLLKELKHLQVKPKPLLCTVNSSCWCFKIKARLPNSTGDCMSPTEMLNQTSVTITDSDRRYLESLKNREFIRNA